MPPKGDEFCRKRSSFGFRGLETRSNNDTMDLGWGCFLCQSNTSKAWGCISQVLSTFEIFLLSAAVEPIYGQSHVVEDTLAHSSINRSARTQTLPRFERLPEVDARNTSNWWKSRTRLHIVGTERKSCFQPPLCPSKAIIRPLLHINDESAFHCKTSP